MLFTLYSPFDGSNNVSKKIGSGAGSMRSKPSILKWMPRTTSVEGSMVTFTAWSLGSKKLIAFLMDFAQEILILGRIAGTGLWCQ